MSDLLIVPREPTEEMVNAAHHALLRSTANTPYGRNVEAYRAMISAAPSLDVDSEIETIVHMVGDKISRDTFSVEAVTSDLHERLTALFGTRATPSAEQKVGLWEAFAQNAENMQNQAPGPNYYKNLPGWRLACCEFARQARDQEFLAVLLTPSAEQKVRDVWSTVLALRNCIHLYPGIKKDVEKAIELLRDMDARLAALPAPPTASER